MSEKRGVVEPTQHRCRVFYVGGGAALVGRHHKKEDAEAHAAHLRGLVVYNGKVIDRVEVVGVNGWDEVIGEERPYRPSAAEIRAAFWWGDTFGINAVLGVYDK